MSSVIAKTRAVADWAGVEEEVMLGAVVLVRLLLVSTMLQGQKLYAMCRGVFSDVS